MIWLKRDIDLDTLFKAITTYGTKNQEDVAIEEMSELTKELIKNRRNITGHNSKNIREEIVDVYIMLLQLILIYGFDEAVFKQKVIRLKERLNNNENSRN